MKLFYKMKADDVREKYKLNKCEFKVIEYQNYINFELFVDFKKIDIVKKILKLIFKNYEINKWTIKDTYDIMLNAVENNNKNFFDFPLFYYLNFDSRYDVAAINIVLAKKDDKYHAINYDHFGLYKSNGYPLFLQK